MKIRKYHSPCVIASKGFVPVVLSALWRHSRHLQWRPRLHFEDQEVGLLTAQLGREQESALDVAHRNCDVVRGCGPAQTHTHPQASYCATSSFEPQSLLSPLSQFSFPVKKNTHPHNAPPKENAFQFSDVIITDVITDCKNITSIS